MIVTKFWESYISLVSVYISLANVYFCYIIFKLSTQEKKKKFYCKTMRKLLFLFNQILFI